MPDIRVALSLYRHPWLVDAAILAVGQRILAGGKIDLEKKAAAYPVQLVQDAPENPEAPDTEKKVDGAVALVMALDRAMKNQGGDSVYNHRGLLVL